MTLYWLSPWRVAPDRPRRRVQVDEERDEAARPVALDAVADDLPADVDELDVAGALVVDRLVGVLVVGDPREEVLHGDVGLDAEVVGRAELGLTDVGVDDRLVVADRLDVQDRDARGLEAALDGLAAITRRVGRVVDADLAAGGHPADHVVERGEREGEAAPPAFGVVGVEEARGLATAEALAAVVADVEDARRTTEPREVARDPPRDVRLAARGQAHHHDGELERLGAAHADRPGGFHEDDLRLTLPTPTGCRSASGRGRGWRNGRTRRRSRSGRRAPASGRASRRRR